MASDYPVQKGMEMESSLTTLAASLLHSIAENPLKSQVPLGRKEEAIPSSKQHIGGEGEDGKSTTVGNVPVPPPISPNSGFTLGKSSSSDAEYSDCESDDLGEIAEILVEHIKKAPNRTIDLTEAAETLGFQVKDLFKIRDIFKGIRAVVELEPNKIIWIFDYTRGMKNQELELVSDRDLVRCAGLASV